jgi:hypothetical protein
MSRLIRQPAEGLAVVSLATLFSSLRKEAAKRGCDGVLVKSGDWIDGVRAACVMLN